MAKVPVRIGLALCAAAIAIGMAVQLRAHDLFAAAVATSTAPHPSAAEVARALGDLRKVSDVQPGGTAFLAAAGLNFRTRHFAAAARAARRAAKRDPENFAAWVTLGVAQRAIGDEPGARAAFARAHTLNPLYSTPRQASPAPSGPRGGTGGP
jgi:Flp pilus assembly protein TadD